MTHVHRVSDSSILVKAFLDCYSQPSNRRIKYLKIWIPWFTVPPTVNSYRMKSSHLFVLNGANFLGLEFEHRLLYPYNNIYWCLIRDRSVLSRCWRWLAVLKWYVERTSYLCNTDKSNAYRSAICKPSDISSRAPVGPWVGDVDCYRNQKKILISITQIRQQ